MLALDYQKVHLYFFYNKGYFYAAEQINRKKVHKNCKMREDSSLS